MSEQKTEDPVILTTLEALRASIAKWEGILAGTTEDFGHNNCALCKLFWERQCAQCPVREHTGQLSCDGSPYEKWQRYMGEHQGWHREAKWLPFDERSRELAQAELDFLKSLLPREVA